MKKRTPISAIMTEHPVTLRRGQTLYEAERMFRQHHIRHLPVVDGDELIGIISLTDLQRLSFADSFSEDGEVDTAVYDMLSLDQVMVNHPRTVQRDDSIRAAAEELAQREFHALPVLQDKKLVGIVTTTDLVRYLLQELTEEVPA